MQALAINEAVETTAKTILIDGQWLSSDKTMAIVNPFNGALLLNVACADDSHVELAIASAKRAYKQYRYQPSVERAAVLRGGR